MTAPLRKRGFLRSPGMQAALSVIRAAAKSSDGVLIVGESGTGREVLAKALHRAATATEPLCFEDLLNESTSRPRGDAPFVVVDCTTAKNIERQMFGECGSAVGDDGRERISVQSAMYQAFGGTLFLRSVQDMPGRVQGRLARVLRDRDVWLERGSDSAIVTTANIRSIASIDLSTETEGPCVVPELHRRIATHRIELPPLRERKDDIPALVRCLLLDICAALKVPPRSASKQATALLCELPWRGNLEEMRRLLRTLVIKAPGPLILLRDVLPNIRIDGGARTLMIGGTLKEAREHFEREYVAAVLEQHHGRMAAAARTLGIERTNLYRKIRQLSVHRRSPARH